MWYDDGFCDAELNNPECGYDGSDCDDEVASTTVANSFPNCNPPVWVLTIWIGDGVCDTQLNNPDCGNDGGDCDDGIASTIQPITTMQPDNCSPSHWIGDNVCDEALNTPECQFDGGDCDDGGCNPPQDFMLQWLGDEICDDVLNLPECQFDGGDCVGVSTEPTGPTTSPSSVVIPPGCIIPPGTPINYLGDDYCDDMLNTEACEFDMGDCDNSALGSTTTPASNCFFPPGIPETWLGDGVCDHVNDFVSCGYFDGWDCPISETNLIDDEDQGIDTP